MTIKAPFLPYDSLRKVASEFLRQYHPAGTIPIPIDAIIDFRFQMEIVPIPGLLASYQIDSSISNDLTTIYIDEFVFKKRPTRYRFSLAHELSHKLIHAELFRQISFTDFSDWKETMNSIPAREYGWIESQAYSLAGLILVPSAPLAASYRTAEESAATAGISLRGMDADAAKIVAAAIGKEFEVSGEVIRKRLRFDGICEWARTAPG